LQDEHLRLLKDATVGPPITRLSLANNQLREESLELLGAWPGGQRLESLDLGGNSWTPRLRSPKLALPALRSLSLAHGQMDEAGLRWLLRSPTLGRLRELRLGAVNAPGASDDSAMTALLLHPVCSELEVFKMNWSGWSARSWEVDALEDLDSSLDFDWSPAVASWVRAQVERIKRAISGNRDVGAGRDYKNGWE
jgi:hypothetical protein